MRLLPHHRRILLCTLQVAMCAVFALGATSAWAQTAAAVTGKVTNQFAAVPTLVKQISIVTGVFAMLAGLNGLYKGYGDPRSSAPLKNIFLMVIGTLFFSLGWLATTSQNSLFGISKTGPDITGGTIVTDKLRAFQ